MGNAQPKKTETPPASAGAVATRTQQASDMTTVAPDAQKKPARGFFTDAETLNVALEKCRQKANLLTPVTIVDHIPDGFGVSMRVVWMHPTPPDGSGKGGGGHVYLPDSYRADELALTKVALDLLALAAKAQWDARQSGRRDDRAEPFYCYFQSVGWFQDIDGSWRSVAREKEIDLRDGSQLVAAWKNQSKNEQAFQRRLAGAREHILGLTESKAANRVTRTGLAIKQKYSREEIALPFVVPTLVFDPALVSDPEVRKQLMLEQGRAASGIAARLYGGGGTAPAAIAPPTPDVEITPETRPAPPVGGGEAPDPEDMAPGADGAKTPEVEPPQRPNGNPWD